MELEVFYIYTNKRCMKMQQKKLKAKVIIYLMTINTCGMMRPSDEVMLGLVDDAYEKAEQFGGSLAAIVFRKRGRRIRAGAFIEL